MTATGWIWVGLGAAVVTVLIAWRERTQVRSGVPGTRSWTRVGLGLGALSLPAFGISLVNDDVKDPPEQRGIGVVIDDARNSPRRGLDMGLTLSAAVAFEDCGQPVSVRLALVPTAEFWIDNPQLGKEAVVHLSIPEPEINDLAVSTAEDGLDPIVTPFTGGTSSQSDTNTSATVQPRSKAAVGAVARLTATRPLDSFTIIKVAITRWRRTSSPLIVTFKADWAQGRSRLLGSCYVRMPALAGFPTVFSAALVRKEVTTDRDDPGGESSFFVVSGTNPDPEKDYGENPPPTGYTYYNSAYEVTRGVASLWFNEKHTLEQGSTLPAPNANFVGSPAWTCKSSIPDGLEFSGNTKPGDEVDDILQSRHRHGTFSMSAERITEVLRQRTCASWVAIEKSDAGTRRDLIMMVIGASFSLGLELVRSGLGRRQPTVPNAPPAPRSASPTKPGKKRPRRGP